MNGIHLACLGAGLILRGLRILNDAICKCDAIVREPLAAAPGRCAAARLRGSRGPARKAIAGKSRVEPDRGPAPDWPVLPTELGACLPNGGNHQGHELYNRRDRAHGLQEI
jgi:hypothetical protein